MGTEDLRERLREVCRHYTERTKHAVTVAEPYIPYIPDGWGDANNGVLILAEAQNHGDTAYLQWLRGLPPEHRLDRLYRHREHPQKIGIKPWDDQTLKLAAQAALGVNAKDVAVSNAVLWSSIDLTGNNMHPDQGVIDLSASVWSEMLAILGQRLQRIVTAGAVPRRVMDQAGVGSSRLTAWGSPSPRVLKPLSTFACRNGLMTRFPEVAAAMQAHPDWATGIDRSKILYACLAVSVAGG